MNGKKSPDGSKFIIRHYHYWSDTKLDPGIFSMRRIPCSWHACTTIWSISWYSKTKEAVNKPRHGRVYTCKYPQIIGCHNIWIIMIFKYNWIDE